MLCGKAACTSLGHACVRRRSSQQIHDGASEGPEPPKQGEPLQQGLVPWYCPHEVLLNIIVEEEGQRRWWPALTHSSVDMWAVGCILGELLDRQLLFPSDGTPQDQMRSIKMTLGAVLANDQGPVSDADMVRAKNGLCMHSTVNT